MSKSYYEILGVAREANIAEIKSAFKKLALQYHPDRNPDNKHAEETFKKINEAYQTLSDENKRWAYNQKILFSQNSNRKTSVDPDHFSTQGNATNYNKYKWEAPGTSAGDYSNQGRHYSEPNSTKKERKSDIYILAFTLFLIIATGALLFGFMMNRIAARDHHKKAISYYEAEDYPQALIQLNLAIEFQDDYLPAYIMRADINVMLERYARALPDYNRAIALSEIPDNDLIKKRDMCKEILKSER